MNFLSKVNLQKKADNLFPSGKAWKLWMVQGDFDPDDSITETELELALSKLKLAKKRIKKSLWKKLHRVRLNMIWSPNQQLQENRTTDTSWWKEVQHCDHCNTDVQEKRRRYLHSEAHCG